MAWWHVQYVNAVDKARLVGGNNGGELITEC